MVSARDTEAGRDGRRGVGASHSIDEAGEQALLDPVEKREKTGEDTQVNAGGRFFSAPDGSGKELNRPRYGGHGGVFGPRRVLPHRAGVPPGSAQNPA